MRTLTFLLLLACLQVAGQPSPQRNASEIKLGLKKLNFLGTALYLAAHPDDENTRAIAYLANERLATTGYLSMTRGDGGQNLIGPEIRDQLGLIRTQELLAARRIDGGHQFFTRANDFGYSKSSEEALQIWGKDEVLSDVVRVIRQFQPDVILTRFPPDSRAGHGHHTASAMLAQEAFDLAANPSVYPDQVKEFGVWQVKGLYTNTGRWWNKDINENTPGIVTMDVGEYNELLGKSYSEIAAESRTQHKSQGFGSEGRRGESMEFFEYVKGYHASKDIFDEVNTTWSRVKGGSKIEPLVSKLIAEFKQENPAASVPALLQVRKEIQALPDGIWKRRKLGEVNGLIRDCLGLYVDARADNYYGAPAEKVQCTFEIVNRSPVPLSLKKLSSTELSFDSTLSVALANNKLVEFKTSQIINANTPYSDPYWLKEPHGLGLFTVSNKELIGKPENDPAIRYRFTFDLNGELLEVEVPLQYKWTDPVKGELWRPFEVVPPVAVNLSESVIVFNEQKSKPIHVLAKSNSNSAVRGEVKLNLPQGWKSEPPVQSFELAKRGEERSMTFQVVPSSEEITSTIQAQAIVNGKEYDMAMQVIDYDHIPIQTLLPPAEAKVVRINLKKAGSRIGYVQGAGDEIPSALRNMGYEVWEMKNDEVTKENLSGLDAVVLGIRALNTNERIRFFMDDLLAYVKNGGTLVVQYNTNFRMEIEPDKFSPYPLTLSRDRVTNENSDIRMLTPGHPVLNSPNKISAADFDGWVQERGLYFPSKWDTHFEPILAMNDPGEESSDGSLLVSSYGQGYYIYTGLSFFRELPEGVAGAYKLFANLVSLSSSVKTEANKSKTGK